MLPQTDWDVGVSAVNDANGMTYSSVGEQPIVSTEIPDTDWTELPVDSHGTAILDIDRDGLLDIYIATGGGMGLESGPARNAVVLWGEPSAASVNGVDQVFRGGRETTELFAFTTPIRSIWCCRTIRVDDINAFGYALINTGTTQR